MREFWTEEELANRMALEQLGEEDDYVSDYSNVPEEDCTKSEEAFGVKEISKKIAKAAFDSEVSREVLQEEGTEVWDFIKKILSKQNVREGLIIGGVMMSKLLLWYSYRKAAKEGLEIVDI